MRCAALILTVFALPATARAGGFSGAHLDPVKAPRRCGGCHAGHGVARSPMLREAGDGLCLICHGSTANRQQAIEAGALSATARPASVEADFRKPYRHPIERSRLHRPGEKTAAASDRVPRHAACADCHDPHDTPAAEPRSVLGLRPRRAPVSGVPTEADLCFRCHGPAANRTARSRDVSRQFDLSATSSHNVLMADAAAAVPSLLAPWTSSSILSCSDCHGSDDPDGPRGPHGSIHAFLLRERYATQDGILESQDQYALCYRCHSRRSILGNESFRHHARHIQGSVSGRGASCRACHSAHGSERHARLIDFDRDVVTADRYGTVSYEPTAAGGLCRLTCHGVEHPIAGIAPPSPGRSPRLPVAPGLEPRDLVLPGRPR